MCTWRPIKRVRRSAGKTLLLPAGLLLLASAWAACEVPEPGAPVPMWPWLASQQGTGNHCKGSQDWTGLSQRRSWDQAAFREKMAFEFCPDGPDMSGVEGNSGK